MSGIKYQICIYAHEAVETVFTQQPALLYITIKSDVQATGNSRHVLHFTVFLLFALKVRAEKVFCVPQKTNPMLSCVLPSLRPCLPARGAPLLLIIRSYFKRAGASSEKHMQKKNLTCRSICFDKQSLSGVRIMASDVASERILLPNAKRSFHHGSECTKD